MARQRKMPDGMWRRGKVYYARFRVGGRLVRRRLSGDFQAASEVLNDLKARADRADFGLLDNDHPLADLRREYLRHADQTLRAKTATRYRNSLDKVLGSVAAVKVSGVSVQAVMAFRQDRLAAGVSARTVNIDVGTLSAMLNWGMAHGLIGSNPLAKMKPLPTDSKTKERRPLSVEEVERLFKESPEYLRPVWRMLTCTGVRLGELVHMRFEDVDFERRSVTVQSATAKNHRAREIPLDDETLATVAQLRDKAKERRPVAGQSPELTAKLAEHFSHEHVFVTKANTPLRNNLLTRFYAICKRAGIEGAQRGGSVDLHSLRVTFTTLAIDHGASPKAVQAILGHSTLGMTMGVYAKATERAKRDAIGALPFAKVSAPEGVIPVQNGHRMSTSNSEAAEVQAAEAVA